MCETKIKIIYCVVEHGDFFPHMLCEANSRLPAPHKDENMT